MSTSMPVDPNKPPTFGPVRAPSPQLLTKEQEALLVLWLYLLGKSAPEGWEEFMDDIAANSLNAEWDKAKKDTNEDMNDDTNEDTEGPTKLRHLIRSNHVIFSSSNLGLSHIWSMPDMNSERLQHKESMNPMISAVKVQGIEKDALIRRVFPDLTQEQAALFDRLWNETEKMTDN